MYTIALKTIVFSVTRAFCLIIYRLHAYCNLSPGVYELRAEKEIPLDRVTCHSFTTEDAAPLRPPLSTDCWNTMIRVVVNREAFGLPIVSCFECNGHIRRNGQNPGWVGPEKLAHILVGTLQSDSRFCAA